MNNEGKVYRVLVVNRMMLKLYGTDMAVPVDSGTSVLLAEETYAVMTRLSSPNRHSIKLIEVVNLGSPEEQPVPPIVEDKPKPHYAKKGKASVSQPTEAVEESTPLVTTEV